MDNRIQRIDAVRGCAILLVIAFHFFPKYFPGGYIGVDIFFVISGFLITKIIIENINLNQNFNLFKFYKNRFLRIIPSLILIVIFSYVIGYIFMFEEEYRGLGKHASSSLLFLNNYVSLLENGYFSDKAQTKPLLNHWSLSIEIQFYVLFPLILIKSYGRKYLPICIVIFFIFSIILGYFLTNINNIYSYYLFFTRISAILAGIILYLYYDVIRKTVENNINILQYFAILIILLFSLTFDMPHKYPGAYILIPIFASVILLMPNNNGIYKKYINNATLVYIGVISYTLYLWHWTLYSFYYILKDGNLDLIDKFLVIIFSFIVSAIIYEKYEIKLKNNYYLKYVVIIYVFLIPLGLFIYINDGINTRTINKYFADNNIKTFLSTRKSDESCKSKLKLDHIKSEVCISNSIEPEVLFIGDSHAMALFIGAKSQNTKSMLIASSGCKVYPNLYHIKKSGDEDCNLLWPDISKILNNIKTLKYIVLVNYAYNISDNSSYYMNNLKLDNSKSFLTGTEGLIELLKPYNKKIIYLVDVPIFKYKPINCINRFKEEPINCTVNIDDVNNYRNDYYGDIDYFINKYNNITFIDGRKYFCDSKECNFFINGKFHYFDKDHLNILGSNIVIKDLFDNYINSK